jgi:signal transduction histidine kinase
MKGRIGIVIEERNRISQPSATTPSWQASPRSPGSSRPPRSSFATAVLLQHRQPKSCELARSMVAHCQAEARRIIWDLRDTDEVTNILSQALSAARSAASPIARTAIQTTLEVEGEELQLAPGCVHHLVCIGQEAVSNAIRHAQPTHIVVHAEV